LAWDRDAAADISKQFETAWKRHKVVCIWAQYFHNVANEFRLALEHDSLGTNAKRLPEDHAQTKR
jgi:hypothetical protein